MSMFGCGADSEETAPEPIAFVSVDPPSGSVILPDVSITVTFSGAPKDLNVTLGEVQRTDRQVITLLGPFAPGELTLTITWEDGAHVLLYTVLPSVSEEMVRIPEGEFEMGSHTERASDDEQPVHTVLVEAFDIDIYEVTVGDYRRFVQETGHRLPDWEAIARYSPTDAHPIALVSWHDAMAYAKWAGKRLPTEAEWEKAARGGLIQQVYPWGNTAPNGAQCNFADRNLKLYWWGDKDSDDGYGYTAPVGSYPANRHGLHDMAGNVREWCLDEYDAGFYAISPHTNPVSGAATVDGILDAVGSVQLSRVVRGGSWLVTALGVRNTVRFQLDPSRTHNSVGFRCVKDVIPRQ